MTLLFTQKQMDDLQTEIRRVIAEDDRDVSECCKCGLSELTNSGIDHLALLARNQIESWLALNLSSVVQSAILAEREACAKAMDQQMDIARNEALKAKEKSDEYTVKYYQGCYEGSRRAQLIIRARPNAPESPNKPLESPENLQSYTFPASTLKTCT